MQRSPQEHFHAWLRTLDPETEGLPAALHRRRSGARCAHYGIDGFDRTPALEDAAYRLFVAEQRSAAARTVALAILDRCLGGRTRCRPAMRETLERVAHVAERRDPVVSDVARECRWRYFDGPVVAAVREAAYADAEQHLDRLAAAEDGPERADGPAGARRLPVAARHRHHRAPAARRRRRPRPAGAPDAPLLPDAVARGVRQPSGELLTATLPVHGRRAPPRDGLRRASTTWRRSRRGSPAWPRRFPAGAEASPTSTHGGTASRRRPRRSPPTCWRACPPSRCRRRCTGSSSRSPSPRAGTGVGAVETVHVPARPDGLREDELAARACTR